MSERQETNNASQQVINDYLLKNFNLSKQAFNPELLKNGTPEQQSQQLQIWANGPASIFIQWIPDDLINKEAAKVFFSTFGKVSRVDIVPRNVMEKFHLSVSIPGNMAFIHFDSWHNTEFPNRFVAAYPNNVDIEFNSTNRYGTQKSYILRTHINTRPVAQVEFNGPQMIDMMENLETRLKIELEEVKAELERTRQEKEVFRCQLTHAEKCLSHIKQVMDMARFKYWF